MDIEQETLNLNCKACQKDFVCTFHTTHCPHCGVAFPEGDVKKIFYAYESQLVNSKAYRNSQKLSKAADTMEKTGNSLNQIGCAIFLLPLGIFCLWFLIQLLSN